MYYIFICISALIYFILCFWVFFSLHLFRSSLVYFNKVIYFSRDFPGGAVVKNCLPMQGTRVRALVWEDPTLYGATKPVHHNY